MKILQTFVGLFIIGLVAACGPSNLDDTVFNAQENSYMTYKVNNSSQNNQISQNNKEEELLLAACAQNAELCTEIPATRHNYWRYIEGVGYRKFTAIGAENIDVNNYKKWAARDYYKYGGRSYGRRHKSIGYKGRYLPW